MIGKITSGHHSAQCTRCCRSNPGFPTCSASTLPTELHCQPSKGFPFLFIRGILKEGYGDTRNGSKSTRQSSIDLLGLGTERQTILKRNNVEIWFLRSLPVPRQEHIWTWGGKATHKAPQLLSRLLARACFIQPPGWFQGTLQEAG